MSKIKPLSKILIIFIIVLLIPTGIHLFAKQSYSYNVKSKFDELLYKYDNFDDELPVFNPNTEDYLTKDIKFINKDKACEDIDYLFSILKYGYSGYEYFGGDESFPLAKENILNLIIELNLDNISVIKLIDIIYSELNFIQDSHFSIGNYKLCNYIKYYSSRKLTFHKNESGFYTFIGDELFYLKEIIGGDPLDYMKPSLDQDGKLIYNLGILSDTSDVFIPVDMILESNNSSKNINISLFEYKPIYKEKINSYRYYEIDDIPILEVNCLCRVTPEDKTIESFIKDSKAMRGKDNLIIDLRNNIGGNIINIERWFKGFTGTKLRKDIIQSGLYTDTSISLSKDKFQSKDNENELVKGDCLKAVANYEEKKYFPGWSTIKYQQFKPVKNNVNIVVLLDKNTSSAAEFFAYYLSKMDNVTLVGTNTNGCSLTGNCNSAYLPNSNIHLSLSHKLYIHPSFINIEGLGLLPDLWIKPEQALDRVVNYINNK